MKTGSNLQNLVIAETEEFILRAGKIPIEDREVPGYYLVNRQTGVIEATGSSEAQARMALHHQSNLLKMVRSGEWLNQQGPNYPSDEELETLFGPNTPPPGYRH